MSVKIMSAIFESETLGPTERLIMLALADHADDSGRCYPSMQRLCKRTGLSDRAIQKNIKDLTEAGYLTVIPQAGQGGANVYIVTATPERRSPPNEVRPRTSDTTPPNVVRQTPERRSPKPSGTIKEPKNPPTPRKRGDDTEAVAILSKVAGPEAAEAFVSHRRHKRAALTAHAATLIARKLAGHPNPAAELERSIMQGWTGVFPETGPPPAAGRTDLASIFAKIASETPQ